MKAQDSYGPVLAGVLWAKGVLRLRDVILVAVIALAWDLFWKWVGERGHTVTGEGK